jgi:small subunit ribosomal protein S4
MTKRINAKKKISRSLGVNLWGRPNDTFIKRNFKPGQHSNTPRRDTNHSIHLRAKQKVRKYYLIREKQFRTLFLLARKNKGNTENNFVNLLESRLASVVYRSNIAPTMYSARQIVSHKHILVNGEPVNIPSYQLKVGDVVQVSDKSKNIPLIAESLQSKERDVPNYLQFNSDNFSVKYMSEPILSDVPYPFETQFNLIIEFYSK